MRKYVFILGVLGIVGAAATNRWLVAGPLSVGLFVWLLYETHRRQRFRFLALGAVPEKVLSLPRLHAALIPAASDWALLVEHETRLSLARFKDGALQWQRGFGFQPLAVAVAPDGALTYATDDEMVLCDTRGSEIARIGFEAPLYRQSYKILRSFDGGVLALHTPWFIQFFKPDLSGLGQRIRFEDTGHYLKYAALAEDGKGLLLAGALLLDVPEDEAAAGIEARWDYWAQAEDGTWKRVWEKAYESYNNTHLRGVDIRGSVLLAEVYQQGYEFHLYAPDGSPLWIRPGGQRAVLSPLGSYVLWQNVFQELILSRCADKVELWKRKLEGELRLCAVDESGRTLLVEAGAVRVLAEDGSTHWQDGFWALPEQVYLGDGGRLCCLTGDKAALIRVPFDV